MQETNEPGRLQVVIPAGPGETRAARSCLTKGSHVALIVSKRGRLVRVIDHEEAGIPLDPKFC